MDEMKRAKIFWPCVATVTILGFLLKILAIVFSFMEIFQTFSKTAEEFLPTV